MKKGSKEVARQVLRKKFNHEDKWKNMKGKLEECLNGLLRWRKKELGAAEKVLNKKTQQLELLQLETVESEKEKIRGLQKELQALLEKVETKWKQKSNKAWLKEGDKTTKYFHICTTQRKYRNAIDNIIDKHGYLWESNEKVEQVFANYYQSLYF